MDFSVYMFLIGTLVRLTVMLFYLFLWNIFFPIISDESLFKYCHFEGIIDGLFASWPIFVWGFVGSFITLSFCSQSTLESNNIWYKKCTMITYRLWDCLFDSFFLGLTEEIEYRWLDFYKNIILSKIFNWCSFGLLRFCHLNIEASIINLFCFNKLSWLFSDQFHWSIGFGAVLSNRRFHEGHAYLGLLGYYSSWYFGWFQFWIVMHYGLPAAILSHTLYDFLILSMYYLHGCYIRYRYSFNYTENDSTSIKFHYY